MFPVLGALLARRRARRGVAAVVVRFRRSRGAERQQMKWFLFAVAPLLLAARARLAARTSSASLMLAWVLLALPVADRDRRAALPARRHRRRHQPHAGLRRADRRRGRRLRPGRRLPRGGASRQRRPDDLAGRHRRRRRALRPAARPAAARASTGCSTASGPSPTPRSRGWASGWRAPWRPTRCCRRSSRRCARRCGCRTPRSRSATGARHGRRRRSRCPAHGPPAAALPGRAGRRAGRSGPRPGEAASPPPTGGCWPTWPGRPGSRCPPCGSPPTCSARASGWSPRARRSAAGCAATCTTGSAPSWPG